MKKIILSFLFLSLSFSVAAQKVDLNYYVPSDEKYDSQIQIHTDLYSKSS
jgi:hypothetical protein